MEKSKVGQERSSESRPSPAAPGPLVQAFRPSFHLARQLGNQRFASMISAGTVSASVQREPGPSELAGPELLEHESAAATLATSPGEGEPLEAGAASSIGQRLRFDFSAVRIHPDASDAAKLGARAFTFGHHVFFAPGAYDPQSAQGRWLLTHELTHVAQQMSGSTEPVAEQERQADAAAAGGSPLFVRRGAPELRLLLKGGTAASLTIHTGASGTGVSFTVQTDTGATLTASGSAVELPEGDYQVQINAGTVAVINRADGVTVPKTSRFDIPWSLPNAPFLEVFANTTAMIPMTVGLGLGAGSDRDPAASETANPDRQAFDALPKYIRDFLVDPASKSGGPPDYAALLRIAKLIAKLTAEELAEYRARTTASTTSTPDFETSVADWVKYVESRGKTDSEAESATNALLGLDEVYEMFRSWQNGMLMGSPPSWIYKWEATPTADLPKSADGTMNQLYLRMRRSLQPLGYSSLNAFVVAIQRFVSAFREKAYVIGQEMLDRFDHTLVEQDQRYPGTAVGELYTSLAPARQSFKAAEEYQADARSRYSGWDQVNEYYAAGAQYKRMKATGGAQVASQSGAHPLLAAQDFPREEIGTADQANVGAILKSYIASHRDKVSRTRKRLDADHEMIFKLPPLVAQAEARQGILPNSVWDKIIADHTAPTVEEVALQAALVVFTVAATVLSGGSALMTAAAFVASSYQAIQQYQDYALKADAYGAQLLSSEPWVGWVVLAIVGAGVDFAVVAPTIAKILPALRAFRAGEIDLATLGQRLASVEDKIKAAILARAEIELQAQKGWTSLLPKGALFASIGLEKIVGPFVYAVYINFRRGINTFLKWKLQREVIDLIGDFSKLGASDLAKVEALYARSLQDVQRIATHGRRVGMTEAEVGASLEAWAKRGGETADDLILQMSRREVAIDRATSAGRVTRSTLPDGHVGGVVVSGPNGTYLKFLPLDEAGRAQGVVARLDAAMLAQATGASASGAVVGRAASQDRGHLLARIIGGPNIPQNLAPLVQKVNRGAMRDLEMAIRDAVAEGGEAIVTVTPIYSAGRVDPEKFLMSVRWKSGKQWVRAFENP